MIELLQALTGMGLPPTTIAVLVLLYKQDKRLTILETLFKGKDNG